MRPQSVSHLEERKKKKDLIELFKAAERIRPDEEGPRLSRKEEKIDEPSPV